MKFTRLRLTGFKSFVEPTDLAIEPGLTGVVGPNGCGKSNLLEALRWVMGESSPKSMRGSGMEDVIFAGSAGRPSRNSAEVSVQVDNSKRLAPAQFNDQDILEISRRIERDAGSVYRINGKDVRQRDVQILFADASTGAHSPALVRQGQIAQLINMKPKQRRAILEEAAGISGLHARRHEAELRLRGAETNLERLNDVIQEIEQQLAGLKRQARQATRYRNLSGEIRRTEAMVLHLRWTQSQEQYRETSSKLAEVNSALTQATQDVARLTSLREEQADGLPELRESEAEAAAALARLKHEQEALSQEEARARRLAEEIRLRIDQFIADLAREESLVREADETIKRLEDESELLVGEVEQEAKLQSEAVARSSTCAEKLASSEEELETKTRELAARDAERARLRNEIESTKSRLDRLTTEKERIANERSAIAPSAEDEAKLTAARTTLGTAEADLQNAETGVADAEEARINAQARERGAREPLQEADKKLSALKAEIGALSRLLATDNADLWPPLIDAMQVEPGFEIALGAALGDELNAPADEAAPVHWRPLNAYENPPPLPSGAAPLSRYVTGPVELTRRLGQIGLVNSVEEGRQLHGHLLPGQRLITREGDLWRWDGFCATAEAPSPAAQRLEQHNRLKELELALGQAEEQAAELRSAFHAARGAAEVAGEAEANARTAVRAAQQDLNQARNALSSAERALAQSATKLSALEERSRRAEADQGELSQALETANAALAGLGDDEPARNAIVELREKVGAERLAASEAKAREQTLSRETALKSERISRLNSDTGSWAKRRENSAAQCLALSERLENAKSELTEAEKTPERIEAQRVALMSKISDADTVRAEKADKLALAETALKSAETHLKEAETHLSSHREARARLEAQADALKERGAEVEAQIRDALDCEPEAAFGETEHKEGKPLPELSASESRLERLRRERENLGGVNLRAEEEASEAQERLDGLITEKSDLEEAIQKLRSGISSLNREGRERILAAFDVVNEHFARLFTRLFNGGEAKLELVESDDPLEAGLEILARPPGKRLATMSLMSGGEQTLTALSLIFAVFLSNPSPICVLDEVDAPLDDTNVDRFCTLLNEMTKSSETRFLVITHHPLTMARMDRLYGVTMAERGISQLVSVDLTAAAALRAAG